ncbi:MAG: alpha/beta hydrolase, partial [Gammaproteobacteria bacterium]|nr:alpha/beta hydrolase [Gammaproteobacteria bacterium]
MIFFKQFFCKPTAYMLCLAMLSGCVGSRAVESPDAHFQSVGWQKNQALLDQKNFQDYAKAVQNEVSRFRIPFDPNNADKEIEQASPVELLPAANCNGRTDGIAILVHGLADTAYSLRDIGRVLAEVCYKSRVILLPGHGTRGGDLLTTRLSDWQETLSYLVDQAAAETDNILLVGFSLGSVLTLDIALHRPDDIDGVIG